MFESLSVCLCVARVSAAGALCARLFPAQGPGCYRARCISGRPGSYVRPALARSSLPLRRPVTVLLALLRPPAGHT